MRYNDILVRRKTWTSSFQPRLDLRKFGARWEAPIGPRELLMRAHPPGLSAFRISAAHSPRGPYPPPPPPYPRPQILTHTHRPWRTPPEAPAANLAPSRGFSPILSRLPANCPNVVCAEVTSLSRSHQSRVQVIHHVVVT